MNLRAIETASELWQRFNRCEWDSAKELLAENFEAYWPQSGERIMGPSNFIELNRQYPGAHKIEVCNCQYGYDEKKSSHLVTTQVFIETAMPNGNKGKLYALSFFTINEEFLITSAKEFWAECYEPPEWRRHLVLPRDLELPPTS